MKRLTVMFIAISMIIIGSIMIANGQETNVNINTIEDGFSVVESISNDVVSEDIFNFWIQNGASEISVTVNETNVEYESIDDNTYSCNLSDIDYTVSSKIRINYKLSKDTVEFEKILLYDISSFSVIVDEKEIYSGSDLSSSSSLKVSWQKPTETIKTERTTDYRVPDWYYIIIVVLIIIVLLSFVFPSKKQKSSKIKTTATGSEELLSTKKTLLMEILKNIEKQHRAKQISDDTYHKLKDQYKQEAVEAMKKLEDMQSKVK